MSKRTACYVAVLLLAVGGVAVGWWVWSTSGGKDVGRDDRQDPAAAKRARLLKELATLGHWGEDEVLTGHDRYLAFDRVLRELGEVLDLSCVRPIIAALGPDTACTLFLDAEALLSDPRLPWPSVRAELHRVVRDGPDHARPAAVAALAERCRRHPEDRSDYDLFAELLRSPDRSFHPEAIRSFHFLEDPRAVAELRRYLRRADVDEDGKRSARKTLEWLAGSSRGT